MSFGSYRLVIKELLLVVFLGCNGLWASNNPIANEGTIIEVQLTGELPASEGEFFEAVKNWDVFCKTIMPFQFWLLRNTENHGKCVEHVAAEYGQVEVLKFIEGLKLEPPTNFSFILRRRDYLGWTALHYACKADCLTMACYLLQQGVPFDSRVNGFLTPEMVAKGKTKELMKRVRKLFESACSNTAPDSASEEMLKNDFFLVSEEDGSLLHMAVIHGSSLLVTKLLMSDVANRYLSYKDANGYSALWWALKMGHEQIALKLFEKCNGDISEHDLACAIQHKRIDFLKELTQSPAFLEETYKNNLLFTAIELKSVKLLTLLLAQSGLDPFKKYKKNSSKKGENDEDLPEITPRAFVQGLVGQLTLRCEQAQALVQQAGKKCYVRPCWNDNLAVYTKMYELLFNAEKKFEERSSFARKRLLNALYLRESQKKEAFIK